MRLVLSIVLSLFLVGCFSQDLEKVGADVVNSLNNKDYNNIWDKYIDDDTKAKIESDLEEIMEEPMVGALMLSMIGVPEDKMETLTSKELFGYVMNLANPVNNPEADTDTDSLLIYEGVELIDENNAIILLKNDIDDSELGEFELVKIGNKWYFALSDDTEDTVEVDEIEDIEEVDEIEVPVDTK